MEHVLSSSNNTAGSSLFSVASDQVRQPGATKPRSCITCRTRRVRCDKRSPCSNCRRAGIACVVPSTEGPPRWARNLQKRPGAAPQAVTPSITRVKERLQNLAGLVKQFEREIEEANASVHTPISAGGDATDTGTQQRPSSPGFQTAARPNSVLSQSGKFCGSSSHYVTSTFWGKIDQEISALRADTQGVAELDSDSSEDELRTPEIATISPTPTLSDPRAFLFGTNPNTSLDEYRPLASQIPYLLEVYERNVNFFVRVIHMPTLLKTTCSPGSTTALAPSDEALFFGVYYAAIASMEDSEVQSSFGVSRAVLTTKYRLGLETCLARADFLNNPTITVVKALTLFLALHRRSESPRFVWMMFGLLTRMAQYLGLHRDGEGSLHRTVFEVEMCRRVWWAICLLDQKVSEDQGTHMVYASLDSDTKYPLNINDADISPQTTVTPSERYGVTDVSFARISAALTDVHRQLLSSGLNLSFKERLVLIEEISQKFQSQYLQYKTDTDGGLIYWVSVSMARLVMAKLTLISFAPVICRRAPNSRAEAPMENMHCTKLFHAAILVAEYNHAMNAEEACRHWRWVYQTCTHWHASVYLALEIPRRQWSPTVERAWVALNSPWLIPPKTLKDQDKQIWFPIRKLIRNVQRHREAELHRLRTNPQVARDLEMLDKKVPFASHPAPFPTAGLEEVFLQRWRRVVGLDDGSQKTMSDAALDDPLVFLTYSAHHELEDQIAQATSGRTNEAVWETADVGVDSFFSALGPWPGDNEMEWDASEDWQAWIDAAFNAEHVELQEVR
ncbi:hypothetical protein P171DRAFT_423715 [Karstenula rhodostoma CBS 690.94]|uniref:Zn(2)-C6 fungal-type domain-containing protein n=1 Tax=Karstenula rhodostoma CBS 690.94 TaxID=1392251 RepID=A0A9P4U6T8_9PLEO|nr:hypothetical protein P171DRAFT_423715 [Karstenula rhodostoma CBS 690.94]